jgi:deoxyguanosine kinase
VSRFIVIEGLIGVGKTTLCRLLRDQWNASLVLEPVEDNPFLAHFYADRKRYAFPAQMFYLATRCAQQMSLQQGELFSDLIVADYLYEKDRLFAEETLEGNEMALYDRFASLLGASVAVPEFVLFLDAATDAVLERIERRAIESEQVIEGAYLESLRDRYYALWERYTAAPVYVLNTEGMNYADDPEAQKKILTMIQGWLDGKPVEGAPLPYQSDRANQLQLFG